MRELIISYHHWRMCRFRVKTNKLISKYGMITESRLNRHPNLASSYSKYLESKNKLLELHTTRA